MNSQTIDVTAEKTETSSALVKAEPMGVGQALGMQQLVDNLAFVKNVMREVMKEGQDYGKIPGTGEKPSLLQPGAQKLLMTFQLREQIKKQTIREFGERYPFHREYEYIVTVFPAGSTTDKGWDGVGTCSTLERKYRFRKAERVCPLCKKSAIIVGKAEYGGGFVCFKKKDGCGAKFPDNDERITSQPAGDVEYDNPADYWNTCSKMAFKRALVHAAINATNTSDLWTQDVEDDPGLYGGGGEKPPQAGKSPASGPSGRSGKTTATQGANQQQRQSPPQQQTTTAPAPVQQYATDKTREHMRNSLDKAFGGLDLVEEYFRKLSNPSVLMPNEGINDLPVEWVPLTGAQLRDLKVAIMAFGEGAEAKHPYPPNPLAPVEVEKRKKATEAKKATEKPPADPHHKPTPAVEAAKRKDPEWFFDIICPIPRKGMKRDAYLRAPDTIGSLYKATKDGDQDAQKRLFGFANNWNPEPRPRDGGGTWPVTQEEINFREALDAFLDWEEKHHGDKIAQEDEKRALEQGVLPATEQPQEEDDVPF